MTTGTPGKRILLIGCGAFAAQAHLPAIRAAGSGVRLAAVADCAGSEARIRAELRRAGFETGIPFIGLPCADLGLDTGAPALDELTRRAPEIDAVIISSNESTHKPYITWSVARGYPTLADKPLTIRPASNIDPVQAGGILDDFRELVAQADGSQPFMLATQRRYQPVYRHIARWLHQSYRATGYPVTYIQCLTNDGLWHQGEDYCLQPSYRQGGGKLIHTGYHVLDLLPWLMRHCQLPDETSAAVRRIASAQVFTTTFCPPDSLGVEPCPASPDLEPRLQGLGEINAGVQVSFRDQRGRVIGIVQIAALHEGFSMNPRLQSPDAGHRARAANKGRTKQDVLSIYQGPVGALWLRRIAKLRNSDGSKLGERNHTEVVSARRPSGDGTQPILDRIEFEYDPSDSAPTAEFLAAVTSGGTHPEVSSPVIDHSVAVKLLSSAYRSASTQQPVEVDFTPAEWSLPPGAAAYLADEDTSPRRTEAVGA